MMKVHIKNTLKIYISTNRVQFYKDKKLMKAHSFLLKIDD